MVVILGDRLRSRIEKKRYLIAYIGKTSARVVKSKLLCVVRTTAGGEQVVMLNLLLIDLIAH